MQSKSGLPAWMPGAQVETWRARAELLAGIRTFFAERGVLEVETPVLSRAGNSDPAISQFRLEGSAQWLRSSPEYFMKRLLAAGSGDIFELGRVFRAGEAGRYHNPEFTLLEWYRVGWTYHQLMDEVSELVRNCLPEVSLTETRITYRDLLRAYADIDPLADSDAALASRMQNEAWAVEGLDRRGLLDLFITHLVQPALPPDSLTFVYDYPADQAALARVRPDKLPVAERFELYLGTQELANGYQELTDPAVQRHRFEAENRARVARGEPPVPLDEHLLDAMAAGLPECAGVALGVDRLLLQMCGANALSDVLAFGVERA